MIVFTVTVMTASAQTLNRQLFTEGWTFTKDGQSRVLNLPHDWGVEGPFRQIFPGETGKLEWWGQASYSKSFVVDGDLVAARKQFILEVDGAFSNAKVYCNGSLAGGWPYGYASFAVDLTPFVKSGSNEIRIDLDNPENSSRWYPGGGIYRNVWLDILSPVGVAHWGTNVTLAELGDESARMKMAITLRNAAHAKGGKAATRVTTAVYPRSVHDGAGRLAPLAKAVTELTDVADGQVIEQELSIENPSLWSPESPVLYYALTTVESGTDVEEYQTPFGIRTSEFRSDGYYLNGVRTFMKGVCLHHDAGALGAAWNTSAWVRRLKLLKEMGCNAIRTSHNPPAPELLMLCDRMGFVVMDELTDTWTYAKKPNGYAKLFADWAEKDLVAMIHRDRNHPSVVMWSIGNECGEQGDTLRWWVPLKLSDICHREDPTRPTTAGNDNPWASTQPYAATIDIYGFNYKPHLYEQFHSARPHQPVYGSETASCVSTRGWYQFPVTEDKGSGWPEAAPFQVSSYDLYAPSWASCPDYEWFYEDQAPYVFGEFVWTGFDYIGEPTPYNVDWSILTNFHDPAEKARAEASLREQAQTPPPSRSSYFGIIDLAGFPKDRFWLYQARWRPELPMAHILPHWNWAGREGQVTPVHVYTSGDSAELFVNGVSKGLKVKEPLTYRLRWDDVVYEPGTVEVVAYKDGAEWARDKVVTTGKPYKVVLKEDFVGSDLIYLRAEVQDRAGNVVPDAANLLKFTVSGGASFVAADAGDPTSHVPFYSSELPAFAGLCSVILRRTPAGTVDGSLVGSSVLSLNGSNDGSSEGLSVPIKVTVTSKGLKKGSYKR